MGKLKIKDIGIVVTGKTPPTSQSIYFGDEFPFVTPSDIPDYKIRRIPSTERFLTSEWKHRAKKYLLPANSICYVCIGSTVGKQCMTSEECFSNQQINSIICDENKANPFYFFYYLKTRTTEIKRIADSSGAGKGIINKTSFENLEIDIPDVYKQNKIASIISAYDDLIENNEKRIKVLEEMTQLLYTEWFVKFKFPGHEKVRMVESGTEYGMIPEGWEIKTFGDSFSVKYGKNLPTSKISESGKYKVYGAGGIIGFYDQKNVDIKTALVTCRGNGSGTVWRTFGEGFITNNSFTVQGKNKNIAFEFIYSCLKRCNISAAISGSAQPQITIESINFVKFILPPIRLIIDFIDQTRKLYALADVLLQKNQNLSRMRDLLIPQLVTGKRIME